MGEGLYSNRVDLEDQHDKDEARNGIDISALIQKIEEEEEAR